MEKRAILAFGLILLVWVLYFSPFYQRYVLGRKSEPLLSSKTTQTAKSIPTKAESLSSVSASPSPQALQVDSTRHQESWDRDVQPIPLSSDSSENHRQIVVESDLFRGVFDTRGAAIQSWRLKKYEGIGTSWVELIPETRPGGPDILLTSENGLLDFSQVVFNTADDHLTLSKSNPTGTLEFRCLSPSGLGLLKRYTFSDDSYAFTVDIELINGEGAPLGNKYIIRWDGGIRVTEPDRASDLNDFRAFRRVGDEVEEQKFDEKEPQIFPFTGDTKWVGVRSKYFFAGIIPQDRSGLGSRLSGRPITNGTDQDRQIAAELEMELTPGFRDQYLIYLGPVDYNLLKQYGHKLEEVVYLGWSIVRPISLIILDILVWLHQWISNYGIVIVLLSIAIKVILFPLTYKSMIATQGMQKIQPKMEELKTKYKNDVQRLNKEMMKLYKEQGVNPLGGCLPLLLQMPILYALYAIFSSTIELRRAPLGWWIVDLSQKDPWYILPLLMGVTMLIQSKMTMKDPRQAAFVYIMPVMLIFFMKDLPAGLILYWTMVNILTIIQQYIQNRFIPVSPVSS